MPGKPAARVGDTTATQDAISGPGVASVLIGGRPAAVAGDSVAGSACTGVIDVASATVLIGGRPAARVGDSVTGTNPASGAPVKTAVGPPGQLSVLIGG